MNGAGANAESAVPEMEIVIPHPPWVSAAAASTGSVKCPALNMAIVESTNSAPFKPVLNPKHMGTRS